jgi:hypothetical protein
MNLNENIYKLYYKNGFIEKYGGELLISILIIFITGVIFIYLQVLNNLEPIKKNWETERCNPFIIPLAGFINNTDKKNKTNNEYTSSNYNFCINNLLQSSYEFILTPFKNIIDGKVDLFNYFNIILASLINLSLSLLVSMHCQKSLCLKAIN